MPVPAPDLMMLLHVASHTLETELTVRLAELGITPRARCALSAALRHELTQSELAEACNLDKTTMVVTMDGLERSGLAERTLSSTDRRARIIAVTEAGRRMVTRADKVVTRVYEDVLNSLPAGQRESFLEGLTQLAGGRLSTPMQCDNPPRRRAAKVPSELVR